MLFYISIWLFNAILTNSFILQDTYTIMLKDSADFKIDLKINENDYEMINEDQINAFNIEDTNKKFYRLDKLANQEYEKALKSIRNDIDGLKVKGVGAKSTIVTEIDNNIVKLDLEPVTIHSMTKKNAVNSDKEYYNYDNLLDEYYLEAVEDSHSDKTYNTKKTGLYETGFANSVKRIVSFDITRNCSEESNHIGIKSIQCLLNEYRSQRISLKIFAKRFWNIIKLWLFVYVVVAVPLWCTRGWCCWCLFCKFFKPRQTIDEAKKYLVLHPPGILKTKNGGIIKYEPTQREKETYEEFDHFIRTL